MKVSIGSKIVEGPWGGGNLFVKNLSSYLKELGHEVIYDLSESDIDLILLTDPRSRRESSSTFNHEDINTYKKFINPNTAVVQRINECDERKNTDNINIFYLEASSCANKVVFVSKWLEDIYLELGMSSTKSQVIMSGSDKKVFKNYHNKIKNNKVKVVTHHWSSHKNKGFESYEVVDKLLKDPKWENKLEFSYIGNSSSDYPLSNSILVEPLSGISLASKLSENDIYLTGSINEPSGNHHIEAGLCGLPILYLESGGIPEYANQYGLSFSDPINLEEKIHEFISSYDQYYKKLNYFPYVSTKMCEEYLNSFNEILENKETYLEKRKKPSFFIFKFELFKYNLFKFTFKTAPAF